MSKQNYEKQLGIVGLKCLPSPAICGGASDVGNPTVAAAFGYSAEKSATTTFSSMIIDNTLMNYPPLWFKSFSIVRSKTKREHILRGKRQAAGYVDSQHLLVSSQCLIENLRIFDQPQTSARTARVLSYAWSCAIRNGAAQLLRKVLLVFDKTRTIVGKLKSL